MGTSWVDIIYQNPTFLFFFKVRARVKAFYFKLKDKILITLIRASEDYETCIKDGYMVK